MAIIDNKGKIRGIVGHIKFRTVGGQTVMQSTPGPGGVKLSSNTRKWGLDFGRASKWARVIRSILYPAIKGLYDQKMINRLNAQVTAIIKNHPNLPLGERDLPGANLSLLDNFEFNENSPFYKAFLPEITPVLEHSNFSISIPEFNIKESLVFPPQASSCRMDFLLSAIHLESKYHRHLGQQQVLIEKGQGHMDARQISFDGIVPQGCLLIATVSLNYFADSGIAPISLNSKMLNPVKVLAAYETAQNDAVPGFSPRSDAGNTWFKLAMS